MFPLDYLFREKIGVSQRSRDISGVVVDELSSTVLDLQKQPSVDVLTKRCSKNIQQIYRRHPCQNLISIKLLCNFIEITLPHGCSPLDLLHIFRTPFPKNSSGGLFLDLEDSCSVSILIQ